MALAVGPSPCTFFNRAGGQARDAFVRHGADKQTDRQAAKPNSGTRRPSGGVDARLVKALLGCERATGTHVRFVKEGRGVTRRIEYKRNASSPVLWETRCPSNVARYVPRRAIHTPLPHSYSLITEAPWQTQVGPGRIHVDWQWCIWTGQTAVWTLAQLFKNRWPVPSRRRGDHRLPLSSLQAEVADKTVERGLLLRHHVQCNSGPQCTSCVGAGTTPPGVTVAVCGP